MKKGFTLIELSIVLVIIGLLIGSVLVARSMIQTARVQDYVRKLQQYEIAFNNFYTNYKTIAGDSATFTPPGNANGVLDSTGGVACSTMPGNGDYYHTEMTHEWAQLSEAGMIEGGFLPWTSTCSAGFTEDTNNWWAHGGEVSPAFAKVAYAAHGSRIERAILYDGSRFISVIPAVDGVALDFKIDDGQSFVGNFYLYVVTSGGGGACDAWVRAGNDRDGPCELYYYVQLPK